MASEGSVRTRKLIKQAAIVPGPFQDVQVASHGRAAAGLFVPWALVGSQPLQGPEVAALGGFAACHGIPAGT
eukprot:scaffold61558_cov37-Prasinocladus_malaysianus.AAC.1